MVRPGITTYRKCACVEQVKIPKGETVTCKCKKVFGEQSREPFQINMRKTWSGTSKIEFNTTTMDKDIAKRMKK